MPPMSDRGRSKPFCSSILKPFRSSILWAFSSLGLVFAALLAFPSIGSPALLQAAEAGEIPTFAVDPSWPKPLPNNWILGQVGGITAYSQGHIWVIHRPRSLTDDE